MYKIRRILGVLSVPLVSAHEGGDSLPDPLLPIYIAASLTILILIYTLAKKSEKLSPRVKMFCFWLIALPVLFSSLYLIMHTLYDTTTSATRGPIHWHADYEVWVCGERLDLIDPKFPKNKIGSPLLHEHNDNRIHIEGTVDNIESVALGRYFAKIRGALTKDILSYPTKEGIKTISNDQTCDGEKVGILKIYVNGKRIANPESYEIYPATLVPPGDCIIIQFDESKSETTNMTCTSWQVKGITYDSLNRPNATIGGRTWQ